MQNINKRIEWIDYLKTFACILVVLGHLLQSFQQSNIDNNINLTKFINWFIYLFHMPLFMMMSGFLYCKTKKNFTFENYKEFALKKVLNLTIPYVTFYMIFILLNMFFTKNVNNPKGIKDILNIFNDPIAPYWFLYALLSIFLIVPIFEKILKDNKKYVFCILSIFKLLSVIVSTNIYFIDSLMSYGIYFYLGAFITEKNKNEHILYKILLVAIYFLMALTYYFIKDNINIYLQKYINIFFALFGIFICVNIFKNIKFCKFFDTIKKYTFQIYLLHTIFAAGIRIILIKIGITNYLVHFVIGMITSIYIPVVIAIICEKIKYLNFFFYPLKTIEAIKGKKLLKVVR